MPTTFDKTVKVPVIYDTHTNCSFRESYLPNQWLQYFYPTALGGIPGLPSSFPHEALHKLLLCIHIFLNCPLSVPTDHRNPLLCYFQLHFKTPELALLLAFARSIIDIKTIPKRPKIPHLFHHQKGESSFCRSGQVSQFIILGILEIIYPLKVQLFVCGTAISSAT